MNFSQLAQTYIGRSRLVDHPRVIQSFNAGDLVPIFWDEVYPGDTYSINTRSFLRFSSALQKPVFDNVYCDIFYFFIPNRLIWSHWNNFMGESDTPYDPDTVSNTDYLEPQVEAPDDGFDFKSIFDYFDATPGVGGIKVSAFPYRAYNLVYNEWFRSESLVDSVVVPSGDSDDYSNYKLLKRMKTADYFTRALPWPQRGPSVPLPIGSSAPCVGNGKSLGLTDGTSKFGMGFQDGITQYPNGLVAGSLVYGTDVGTAYDDTNVGPLKTSIGVVSDSAKSGLVCDLSDAVAATVTELRNAFQVQKLYERDARGGTRYTEIIRSHFGVISPDARLQRPEYLGGCSNRMLINTVVQNSASGDDGFLGDLAAFGLTGSYNKSFTKSFTEHGHILGLVNIRTDLTYQQGIPRIHSRRTRLDYYWPTFAHLSEQAILRKEIYAQGTDDDEEVFGYQERYSELRYFPSHIRGEMRSDYPTSLDVWHLAEDFAEAPTLSQTFIENPAQSVLDRALTVQSSVSDQIIGDFTFDLVRVRPLPLFGTPGLVDHF